MKILVDAMGGDNAPEEIVEGCIEAVKVLDGYEINLLGDKDKIERILSKNNFSGDRIKTMHTTEVITNDDVPTKAIKSKKDSSMVVGLKMLKENQGDVFLSAGNTGALSAGSLLIVGRMEGVDRPALAPLIPTKNGPVLLIDAGLNTNCRPINYLQFAQIGSTYMREMYKIKDPKVGLINIGTEANKGYEELKQAYLLLSNSGLNFVGNIEGRQLPEGEVDVAVCDGFVGNVLLKFLEGVGSFILEGLSGVYKQDLISKLSALMIKRKLKKFLKKMDYEEYGGTPILGINGTVFKCHGSSNAKSIKNAIIKAYDFARNSVLDQLRHEFYNREAGNLGI